MTLAGRDLRNALEGLLRSAVWQELERRLLEMETRATEDLIAVSADTTELELGRKAAYIRGLREARNLPGRMRERAMEEE